MRLIAAIEQPEVVEAILRCLGLSTRAPPTAAARPLEFPEVPGAEFSDAANDRGWPLAD